MKKLKTILVAGVSLLTVSSCSFFDGRPEDFVSSDENFKEKTAIYANFVGLVGLLQDVTDQLVYVAELRGDLMMPTDQATDKYWDIFNYDMTDAESNDLYNPAPFYKIVMNSNDFLRNTVEYNSKYPGVIPTNIYRQMIAGAVCLRTWAYLTLGKFYGGAVYYDYALSGEVDIASMVDEKWLSLEELVPQLIYFMTTGVDRINGLMLVQLDQMFGMSGNQWRRMCIHPDPLLTELYLWNKNYDMAARRGIYTITDKGVTGAGDGNRWALAGNFQGSSWKNMFKNSWATANENEAFTVVFWRLNQGQDNSFVRTFNTTAGDVNGEYLLKPTQAYTDLFYYPNSLVSNASRVLNYPFTKYSDNTSGFLYDPRLVSTVDVQNGQAVITKLSQDMDEKYFYIYRAAELYLFIAEALVGEGKFEAADSLINYGTRVAHANGEKNYPFNSPVWWHNKFVNCNGIRGRVGYDNSGNRRVPRIVSTSAQYMNSRLRELNWPAENPDAPLGEHLLYQEIKATGPEHPRWNDYLEYAERRTVILDSLISVETGRELGFEGKRFHTLVRMAMHLNNPDILALQIMNKHENPDDAFETAQMLRNPENWFIKYDLKMMNK